MPLTINGVSVGEEIVAYAPRWMCRFGDKHVCERGPVEAVSYRAIKVKGAWYPISKCAFYSVSGEWLSGLRKEWLDDDGHSNYSAY